VNKATFKEDKATRTWQGIKDIKYQEIRDFKDDRIIRRIQRLHFKSTLQKKTLFPFSLGRSILLSLNYIKYK